MQTYYLKQISYNLVPDIINPSPDYYCTWQTQLYATNDGKPAAQRAIVCEKSLFDTDKPFGWAHFYKAARKDLILVMDDSWDVPPNNDSTYYGCLQLNSEKFPTFTKNKTNSQALKCLSEKIKGLGWKGLGVWVCAQESKFNNQPKDKYWQNVFECMNTSDIAYWKVDWGESCNSFEFRKELTDYAHKYAPNLIIEHAMLKEILPYCNVFRTYDVPAIMSIPMTLQKIAEFSDISADDCANMGMLNCEDEAYIAAAGGFTMGIMRHPYSGDFLNGRPDMSFPAVHRNLKTKMYEIIRATRWHRIAPAFPISPGQFKVSQLKLTDNWKFKDIGGEIEEWWLRQPLINRDLIDGTLTKHAPSSITRNTILPEIEPDTAGNIPYCVATTNPNGAFSIATLGRTIGRDYYIPKCNIAAYSHNADTVGIFGEYKTLTLKTEINGIRQVLMQDLAGDICFDVTANISINGREIHIPGELIAAIGTSAQPVSDTSEPGVVLKLIK